MFFDIETRNSNAIAAIEDSGGILTYGELKAFSEVWSKNVECRSLIFILTTNSIPSLKGYVASLSSGVVPLLLDSKLDGALLNHLIQTYEPQYIWAPENTQANFGQTTMENGEYALHKTDFAPYLLAEELGLLLTTSGSTGSPKLVRQSYDNIRANTASICQYLEINETERPITTLPMSYTYGLSIINSHLASGATLLLTNFGVMQREFWDFFKERRATSFGGVPYTYEMLKRLRFFKMNLPTLHTFTQAGGKLIPDLHREFAEYAIQHGKRFIVMYGQTEATARMSFLPWQKALDKHGSMGIAIPGGAFSLIDADGSVVEGPETVGELLYRGRNVALGYAEKKEDLAIGDEWHGALLTGDMAKRDAEGYYYIVGRKKRFLKIFGNRVNLDEIERMVKNMFGIECACSGEDDRLKIYIVDPALSENTRKYICGVTGIHFSAVEVKAITAIPKNNAGKTLYKELK
jgi:acyl-coenzyme A synthetase/AMP-(fatty) acid ligase